MTIADKLALLTNTKEVLRTKLKLTKSIPFSKYPNYVNWQNAPSIPNKAFYADFTNDRYVKDGVPCSFKDLFAFNRAGKAWLVKSDGLQEYAANVPRFDNGLLIERSATSYSKPTADLDLGASTTRSGNTYTITSLQQYQFSQFQPLGAYPAGVPSMPTWDGKVVTKAIKISGVGGNQEVSITTRQVERNSQARLTLGGTVVGTGAKYANGYLYSIVDFNSSMSAASLVYPSNFVVLWGDADTVYTKPKVGATLDISDFQYILGTHESTLIGDKSATAITRPADYLTAAVTGTTITGDWDSTLTLSIVDGQLVHSGYGRIRTLEIK